MIEKGGTLILLWSAAKPIKGLSVDPGGYAPEITLSSNGRFILSFNFNQFFWLIPLVNKLGSNVGWLT